DRAVDVADDPRRARHRGDFHGAIEAAGLCRVDRDDLRGASLDDLDRVVRVPRAFVGHYRHVDRARDLRAPRDALHRLLEVDQVVTVHAPERIHRVARRALALIGVATERDAGSHSFADAADHLHVAFGIDTDLDLDRADAFVRDLGALPLGLVEADEPDRMRHRNAPSARAAEEAMHRQPALPPGEIIGREFDRGLGIRVALDGEVHARL